jgi:aspartate aminotransferase/aromatic-amino-acid transaminase
MAKEFDLLTEEYNLFDGNHFDITSFKSSMNHIMNKQGKVLVILNDPCHNPSGYTMSDSEWAQVMSICEEVSNIGPVILLHDIAYVDFSTNPNWKASLIRYQTLPSNMMVVIAFSLSKTFTAYGMRVGASIAISNDKEQLEAFKDATIYSARSIWSTVNNSVMELFHHITTNPTLLDAYQREKQSYIDLIQERATIFVTEANNVGLPLYPHNEGFFATILVDNDKKEALNQSLQAQNIFLVEVNNGLRVALCSVPKQKLIGLAKRIHNIMYT